MSKPPPCNGRKAEGQLAKEIGARLTPASGALEGAKGDMTLPEFLVEAKSTQNKSISLKKSWLDKIAKEALHIGKIPLLAVMFTNNHGDVEMQDSWVCMRLKDFEQVNEMMEEYNEVR